MLNMFIFVILVILENMNVLGVFSYFFMGFIGGIYIL